MNKASEKEVKQEIKKTAPPDAELVAIKKVRSVIADLSPTAQLRVLHYCQHRIETNAFDKMRSQDPRSDVPPIGMIGGAGASAGMDHPGRF